MNLSQYESIIFDLDDTLLDFHYSSAHSFQDLCDEIGFSYQELYPIYRKCNSLAWNQLERGEIQIEELSELRFRYLSEAANLQDVDPSILSIRYLDGLVKHNKAFPMAHQLLNQLKDLGSQLFIGTNGLKYVQRRRVHQATLETYFQEIIVSEEIGVAKPSIEFFETIFEKCQTKDKKKILMVGDSLRSDIEGAAKYGFDTAWINRGKYDAASEGISPSSEFIDIEAMFWEWQYHR